MLCTEQEFSHRGTVRRNRIHLRSSKERSSSPSGIGTPVSSKDRPSSLPGLGNSGSTENSCQIEPRMEHTANGSAAEQQPLQQNLKREARKKQGVKPSWLKDYVPK